MNFDLDDDQRALADAARSFFTASASPSAARLALDDGTPLAPGLKAVCDVGFYGITVPESAGGGGGSLLDLAVVAEQAGRVLSAPSLVTPARVAILLADSDLLAGLGDGSLAFAVLDGTAPGLDAATAEQFVYLDGDVVLCGPGVAVVGKPIDPTRGLASVTVADGTAVGSADRWSHAKQVGQVILAAEGLGAASAAVEMGVAYAKERMAFGRPIGSYQAVKHALVDAYVGVEQLRSLVWWAAWAADEAPEELPMAAAAAKGTAAQVLEHAAETLIQVHGGIGFTWEHDAHLFWRRAKVDRLLLGDDIEAFDTVAQLALAPHLAALPT